MATVGVLSKLNCVNMTENITLLNHFYDRFIELQLEFVSREQEKRLGKVVRKIGTIGSPYKSLKLISF